MDYFGNRRTDYTEGDMYQGVDTPSQVSRGSVLPEMEIIILFSYFLEL